jgi:hypothetical protein
LRFPGNTIHARDSAYVTELTHLVATWGTVLFSETEQLRVMTRRIDRSALISSRMSRRGCSVERLIHMCNLLTSADRGRRQGFAFLPTDTFAT